MDPMAEEQLDYEEEDYASATAGASGGGQKLHYPGGGAISALAEEELLGEDDDYDDLYNDVNVGEGFMNSIQQNQPPNPNPNPSNLHPAPNGLQPPPLPRAESSSSATGSSGLRASEPPGAGVNIPGVGFQDGKGSNNGISGVGGFSGNNDYAAPKTRPSEIPLDPPAGNLGHRGSLPQGKPVGVGVSEQGGNMAGGPASMPGGINRGPGILASRPPLQQMQMQMQQPQQMQMQPQPQHQQQMQMRMQPQQQMQQPPPPQQQQQQQMQSMVETNGNTMLLVGELHWWTTDAELEGELSKYGKVKEIKFFDERASGKSKGYCQAEFYDAGAAAACKEGMNGHVFNGRACVVVFASQQNLRQMGAAYLNKTQAQAQTQHQGRRGGANNNDGNRNGMNYQGGTGDNRNYGRMGSGGGGQGMQNRGQGGNYMQNWAKGNMGGGGAGGASGGTGGGKGMMTGAFGGPAVGGPPGALMHPQGLMGPGFDPTYGSHMGRGGIYGGFSAPGFPGMMPTFPAVNNAVGLPGVAPHVNPAFFGRGMSANGMGMMGTPGMDGHPAGMWTDPSMGAWTSEEHGRTRESSYGEDGASDYGYGESQDRGGRPGNASRDKDRVGSDRDSDRRHRDDREGDWDRHRYRDDKERYSDHRHRERDWDNEEDWDRGRSSSSRSRGKTRMSQEEEKRSRSRDVDYGKRRRMSSE
ncbi:unnamed protein product [Victoria cruziana]